MGRRTFLGSLTISVMAHALGGLYLATHIDVPVRASAAVALELLESQPPSGVIDVEWIDEREPASKPSSVPATPVTRPVGRTEFKPIVTRVPAGRAEPERANPLAMRTAHASGEPAVDPQGKPVDGRASSLLLRAEQAARAIVGDPGPPEPRDQVRDPLALPDVRLAPGLRKRSDEPASELVPAGGGTFRGNDLTFVARVDRDGRVTLEDRPNLHFRLGAPDQRDGDRANEGRYNDPYAPRQAMEVPVLVSAGFDVTDWAMRASGQDPYAHRKMQFLDRTRDERVEMARTEHGRVLDESLASLPGRLVAIWSNTRWSAEERRKILFELWDECAEEGPAEVIAAGNQARAMIIAFIQNKLPAGSPLAFPDHELVTFDRVRKSANKFDPYR